ncbi:hypothetical protein LTR62_008539 [Meristemomyces frigidus]|uniref:Opi1-domain-containing protein n=1 Tax=Meristemomyces frigidus TaxID=1508187 RepID=A0AAN7TMR3_9PEZI|nr:hypothetical protein LTR62_008539 [Meristemomyces frigidus]
MEMPRPIPPPYSDLSPLDYSRPPLPPDEMVAARRAQADITLPDLKTVLSSDFQAHSPEPYASPTHSVRSLPRIDPGPHSNGSAHSMHAIVSNSQHDGRPMSMEEYRGESPNVLSAEQLKMREAAEALAGLSSFDRSQSGHYMRTRETSAHNEQEQEPLLHLITQAHPRMSGVIDTSIKAYYTGKSYTPGFVQASADLVERNIASPVINTVGTVSKYTGVNRAARWYYTPSGTRERMEDEEEDGLRSKRKRVADADMDVEAGLVGVADANETQPHDSRPEYLPAYHASKPPSYREEVSPATTDRNAMRQQRPQHNRSWSQQLVVSAGGLGVALSERSRHTLAHCLSFLSRNAQHIITATNALKLVLEQYDQARDQFHKQHDASLEKGGERPRTPDHDDAARRLAEIMKSHCDDIWRTLKHVVTSVSDTAGGALPSNAREFVRNQIMSLPRRWQMISTNHGGESESSRHAHRIVAFATEGLDMMSNVGQACHATLESAERWVGFVGGRGQQQQQQPERGEGRGTREQERECVMGEGGRPEG